MLVTQTLSLTDPSSSPESNRTETCSWAFALNFASSARRSADDTSVLRSEPTLVITPLLLCSEPSASLASAEASWAAWENLISCSSRSELEALLLEDWEEDELPPEETDCEEYRLAVDDPDDWEDKEPEDEPEEEEEPEKPDDEDPDKPELEEPDEPPNV